jgi:uncharacterized Zn finger protein
MSEITNPRMVAVAVTAVCNNCGERTNTQNGLLFFHKNLTVGFLCTDCCKVDQAKIVIRKTDKDTLIFDSYQPLPK